MLAHTAICESCFFFVVCKLNLLHQFPVSLFDKKHEFIRFSPIFPSLLSFLKAIKEEKDHIFLQAFPKDLSTRKQYEKEMVSFTSFPSGNGNDYGLPLQELWFLHNGIKIKK